MKSDRPKQFIELGGEPIIIRTLRCFLEYNPDISVIICVHRNYMGYLENILDKYSISTNNIRITLGGDSRFESVKNGLKLIEDNNSVVAIHDAARPFVSQQTIGSCFETAALKGNAVPCVPVNDSMRKISNNINIAVNRNEFKIVQTPQCFHVNKIKKAFEQPYTPAFTDDATVLECSGEQVFLVEGNEENIKITSPHDLRIASALLS
jgi:2-C-methyl-D-erythritol 4-phosphate cytidylyltransferase